MIYEYKESKCIFIITLVAASTFSPLANKVLMTETWPFIAAVCIPLAPF